MKKWFYGYFLLGIFCCGLVACDQATETAKNTEQISEAAKQTASDLKKDIQDVGSNLKTEAKNLEAKAKELAEKIPQFESDVLQEFVNSYEKYIHEFAEVVKDKDMVQFAKLTAKGDALARKAMELTKQVSPDEFRRLSEYMKEKAKTIRDLTRTLRQ